jgi:hypothetical protein
MATEILIKTGATKTWKASGGDYAITLASLAVDAARQGVKGDLGATRGKVWGARVTANMDVAPTAGTTLELYWAGSPSATAGTSNPGATTGTDAAYTGSAGGTVDQTVLQLEWIGSLILTPDADGVVQVQDVGRFVPVHRYGMPVLVNKADQAMEGDDDSHKIEIFEVIDESQ